MANAAILIISKDDATGGIAFADDAIPAPYIAADGSTIDGTTVANSRLGSLLGTRYGGTSRAALTLPSQIPASLISGLAVGQEKTTATAATNTVTETDLTNGAFTVAANGMGTTKALRFYAHGDGVQNSGGSVTGFRLKVKIGSTTVIDTGTGPAFGVGNSATRFAWDVDFCWQAQGATNAQWLSFHAKLAHTIGSSAAAVAFTTGSGFYAVPAAYWSHAVGGAATAIDTTAAQTLQLTVINPSASSTELKLQTAYYLVEGA